MSNYFSILYYNSEVWLLPTLNPQLKKKLLSASSAPLKLTTNNYNYLISFTPLDYVNKRATPDMIQVYKHALLLHKIYNNENANINWIDLFFTRHFNNRDRTVKF